MQYLKSPGHEAHFHNLLLQASSRAGEGRRKRERRGEWEERCWREVRAAGSGYLRTREEKKRTLGSSTGRGWGGAVREQGVLSVGTGTRTPGQHSRPKEALPVGREYGPAPWGRPHLVHQCWRSLSCTRWLPWPPRGWGGVYIRRCA